MDQPKPNAVEYRAFRAPQRAAPSWPDALDEAAFHGLAGEVVRSIAPHSEADEAALLISFLAAFGNVIGRRPFYRVEADRHFGNLFAVLVGETSKSRKGTSWGNIYRLFKRIDDGWAAGRVKSGLSSGEGIIWDVRDRKGEEEAGVLDKRLLVQEAEFASVLRRMEREGNTLSAVLREAWDGRKLAILTKNSPAAATDAHISIIAHTTTEELRRFLTRTEMANGFGNRFLFLCVRRSRALPHGGRIDEKRIEALAARVARCIDHAAEGELYWDAEGAAAWEDIYPILSEGHPGMLGAVMGRAEAQVVRLALLYALLDEAQHIGTEHLCAALAIHFYAHQSAAYIFGDNVGDPIADMVLVELQGAGAEGMAKMDLTNKFGRHVEQASRLSRALDELLRSKRIILEKITETGGRPETRYRLA